MVEIESQAARSQEATELMVKVSTELVSMVAADPAMAMPPDQVAKYRGTMHEAARRIRQNLPPFVSDAALAATLGEVTEVHELLGDLEQGPANVIDLLDKLLIHLEAIRHMLRDALHEDVPCNHADAQELARLLALWLPGINQREIAGLCGVSTRQVQRWMSDGGTASPRLLLVTRLVGVLRHSWTPHGVVAWFGRPHPALHDKRPLEVVADLGHEQELLTVARQGRAQHGS